MSTDELPHLDACSSAFSEEDAFARAEHLYDLAVEHHINEATRELLAGVEYTAFRQAVELQLAGLTLLGTKDLNDDNSLPIPFACFAVDHLLWGMSAAANGQVRIAFTLVRGAVEAAIFEVAAATDRKAFRDKWSTREGTGGAVLRTLKGSVDPSVKLLLEVTWKHVAALGHASRIPVLSGVARARSGTEIKKTISFAGQYAGPLDVALLHQVVNVYALAALASVEAMNIAIIPHLHDQGLWKKDFAILNQALNSKVAVPAHLVPLTESEWGRRLRDGFRKGA